MSSSIEHKTKRLLVVDDEYFNFEMLKAALASKFDVTQIQGKAALRQQLRVRQI